MIWNVDQLHGFDLNKSLLDLIMKQCPMVSSNDVEIIDDVAMEFDSDIHPTLKQVIPPLQKPKDQRNGKRDQARALLTVG